ncbi:MAG: YaeQ family protein [Myxococcales bacterium]|nr:YaeQ family protein [Myxococcales bacterium]
MRAFRCQVRLSLSDIDRGVYAERVISIAQEPDEPDEHILLRFLSFVFFYDERLRDAGGWTQPAQPDLLADDLIGDVNLVIECGMPQRTKRLVKALGRHKGARIIVLLEQFDEWQTLKKELTSARARNVDRLEVYRVSQSLMNQLEAVGSRNMEWTATINEGVLYLDCDGEQMEGGLKPAV